MKDGDDIEFGSIDLGDPFTGEGFRLNIVRRLPRAAVAACPHVIMVPEHYREDDTCRCDDPDHTEMRRWGYRWRDGRWR